MTTTPVAPRFTEGVLVRARDREWVVVDASDPTFLLVRPLAGADEDISALMPALEQVREATFPKPTSDDLGDATAARLLRDGLRIGFRASGGPFRSLAGLAVTPRAYQYVPLLMALRQGGDAVRLLIADGVGIGKTVEAGLVAAELLAQGEAKGLAVLCSPALAPQWRDELRTKFNIDATLVLPSTVNRLNKGLRMGESLFDRHPYVVVSTDLIKQRNYRDDFARTCPDLVIVDEAHTSVTAGGANSRSGATLRHHLLQRLADDQEPPHAVLDRHPAPRRRRRLARPPRPPRTPNWNISPPTCPDPSTTPYAPNSPATSCNANEATSPTSSKTPLSPTAPPPKRPTNSTRTTGHCSTGSSTTPAKPSPTTTSPEPYANGSAGGAWSPSFARWPPAPQPQPPPCVTAPPPLEATTDEEADEIGRNIILDEDDDAATDADDIVPGADDTPDGSPSTSTRRRLLEFARQAEALTGPAKDAKLARLTDMVKRLLDEGYNPIVFCRYIPTAEYVGEHLRKVLKTTRVEAVTGIMPPEAREAAVADLGTHEGPHVLVATDCLSEGVNLQDYFTAVIHYDLAWNPTRHEQREGRIDRFGQRAKTVRAITYYGIDNPVDGVVLNVLLRKHETIRKSTGVSVSLPADSAMVMQAVFEGLILRRGETQQEALFDLPGFSSEEEMFDTWQSTAEREKRSRSRFAQHALSPAAVSDELKEVRAALGGAADVEHFARNVLIRLGATISEHPDINGFVATLATLPRALRDMLPIAPSAATITFVRDLPAPVGAHVLTRTDLAVEALASYALDAALDPLLAADFRPARRSGVMRTNAVTDTTTLLVTRMRFHANIPGRDRDVPMVVEEAHLAGFTGTPDNPTWLSDDAVADLLTATPSGNIPESMGKAFINPTLDALDAVTGHLSEAADKKAKDLDDSHRRVRQSAGAAVRGLRVTAQKPVDILGVYIFVPGGTA